MCPAPFISGGLKPGGVHSILEGNCMSEENNLTSGADDLPPAIQKTKEQWLDEGNFLSFYAPIRSEEGLAAYEQVIRLDDDEHLYSYLAYVNSSTTLATLSRYEEALAACEGAIRFEPRHAHNYVSKGWLLERLVRHEEALAAYQEASRIEPNNADIWWRMGDVLTSLERPQEAQQAYEKARHLDSGHA